MFLVGVVCLAATACSGAKPGEEFGMTPYTASVAPDYRRDRGSVNRMVYADHSRGHGRKVFQKEPHWCSEPAQSPGSGGVKWIVFRR